MDKKKKLKKLKQPGLNAFTLVMIIVALTLIINTTVAWFAFSNKGDAELSLGFVKLDTNIEMTEDLTNIIPNKPIITAASFTKTEGSTDCFVRVKLEYFSNLTSLTREEKNYVVILNAYDYSNKITTGVDGVNWVPTTDGYYYLLDNNGDFVKVADGDSYKFLKDGAFIEFPILLGSWLYPSYDSTISDLHINLEFQAVQSSYLPSEEYEDIVNIFELCFPDDRKFDEVLVKFDSMGGSRVEAQVVEVGDRASIPTAPVREDHTFDGWYSDSEATTPFNFNTKINKNTTIYAKWIENNIVTYNTLGGTSIKASSVTPGDSINAPTPPTRVGYTFDKWYTQNGSTSGDWGSEVVFPFQVNEDITLYAKWIQNVELQFETFEGTKVNTYSVAPDTTVIAPTNPTREDYNFGGWYSKDGRFDGDWGEEIVFPLTLSSTMKIYAKWNSAATRSFTDGLIFNQNVLVGYTGLDTEVVVPASYSLTGNRIVDTNYIANEVDLYGAINEIQTGFSGANIFPVTFTTQTRTTMVFNNAEELEAFDPTELEFPYTISYERDEYVDGNDYVVTELGDMAFCNMTIYVAMMGIDFDPVLLTKVSLPNSLRKIGYSVFMYQTKLENIIIPEGVIEIGSLDTMYGTMSVVLPSTLASVSDEFGNESVTEYINFSSLTSEDLNLGSDETMVTSYADSKVYKYVDGDDSFLFYVDGANTRLGLIKGTGKVTTPNSGVTLRNIHNENKTTILGDYGFIEYKNCITTFDELVISGGAKYIDCAPFVYAYSVKSLIIDTPLNSLDDRFIELLYGVEVVFINETVDSVSNNALHSETGLLQYVLCATDEIAESFTDKGINNESIYVLQEEGYEDITFEATETAGVSTGKDHENKSWVRTGEEGGYTYYRRYEKGNSFSDGLFLNENKVMGYIGSDINVVVPETYSKSGRRITKEIVCNNYLEFMSVFTEIMQPMLNGYKLFPLQIIETDKTTSFRNVIEMDEFNPENVTYPATVSFQYDEVIEGTDYTITEIGPYGLSSYGMYVSMMIGAPLRSYIETVTLPDTITTIGEYAFAFQSKITSLEIPEGVTEIGVGAFELCIGLNSLVLPASLENADGVGGLAGFCPEIIYFGNTISLEDLGFDSFITSKDDSKIYQYKEGKNIFYFYVNSLFTLLAGIKATGSVTLPDAGVTLTGLYDKTKTTTLKNYSVYPYKLVMPMYDEIIITGGVTDILEGAFVYPHYLNRVVIDKPLDSISDSVFSISMGLEAIIVNYPITEMAEVIFDGLISGHLLCATQEIAESLRGKGISDNLIYVEQTTGYQNLIFGEIGKAGIAYAIDDAGLSWARDGRDGEFTYYKQYEVERSFTHGLIFNDNKVIGYVGDAKKVEIPASYTATGNTEVISKTFNNKEELTSFLLKLVSTANNNECPLYPMSVISSTYQVEYNNTSDSASCLDDIPLFSYPALVTFMMPEFIDGNDNIVTEIAPNAFKISATYFSVVSGYPMYNLIEEIVIPEGVTTLGDYAFAMNPQLHTIHIPSSVNQLGSNVFAGDFQLPSIVLPQGLTTIDSLTFDNSNIKEIINLSTTIANNDINLSVSDLPSTYIINSIADSKIYKYVNGNNTFYFHVDNSVFTLIGIIGEGNVTTPSAGVTLVGMYDNTKTVTLGNYVIDEEKCGYTVATSLIVSDSVTAIGKNAFRESPNLQFVTLGKNITSIGEDIFYYNKNLQVLNVHCNPTTIADQLFVYCDKLEYILCDNDEIALKFFGKGVDMSAIFVKQSETPSLVTFAETQTSGISTGVDSEEKVWVRIGEEGDYTYYRTYERGRHFSDGLLLVDNRVVGYIGADHDVVIPETYAKTGNRITRSATFNNQGELMVGFYEIYLPLSYGYNVFPITFIETDKTTVLNSVDDMGMFNPENFTYPLTMTYEYDEYVDGTDYTITEIGEMGLVNYGLVIGVQSGYLPESYIETINLPNTLTTIGQSAFAYQTKLATLEIPEGVIEIGESVFEFCLSLTSLVLPESLQTMFALDYMVDSGVSTEIIYLGNRFTAEELGLYSFKTTKDASTIYKYVDGENTFYFNVSAETELFTITGKGSVETPDAGVTLTNIYNDSKTTTLSEYSTSVYSVVTPTFEELTITGGITGIGSSSILHGFYLQRATIDTPLEFIGEDAFAGCVGLEALIVNAPIDRISNNVLGSTLNNHVLCATEEIAESFRESGMNYDRIYVKQTSNYGSLKFGEVSKVGISYAMDDNGIEWIRDTQDGSYVYYKQLELERNFTKGLIFDEGRVIGYIGDAKKVEIPTSYTATGNTEVITKSVNNKEELASVLLKLMSVANNDNNCPVFPITVASLANQFTYEDTDDLGTCLSDIESISYPALVTYAIPEYVDGNDYTVTEIGSKAFYLLGGFWSVLGGLPIYNLIEEIVIPEGVTTIGENAFGGNVQLHKLNLPSSVIQIGASAFHSSYAIPSIILPQGITTIDANAFESSYITEIINLSTIPNNSIDLSNDKISSSYIINSIADSKIYTYTQDDVIFYFHVDNGTYTLLSIVGQANEVTTPSAGVTLVGLYDPSKTVVLASYTIGEQKCGYLAINNLVISSDVTAIGDSAFKESPYLQSVTLGKNIKSIGKDIFYYNMNLHVVDVQCDPISMAENVFEDCLNLKYVLFDSLEVADKFVGKGIENKVIFIKENNIDGSLTFSETGTAGISSAVDFENYRWIRIGEEGNYTYYKQYVTKLPQGLILQDNQIIGYVGNSQKVEIPATYTFTGNKQLVTQTANDQAGIMGKVYDMLFAIQNGYDCYPFTIASDARTDVFNTAEELMNTFDPSKYSAPATISYYVKEYKDGEDYAITEIGAGGLANISKLMVASNSMGEYNGGIREVVIPEDVTSLGQMSFAYQNLVKVEIPEKVNSIGEQAFMNSILGSVYIPMVVSNISSNIFEGATIFELIDLTNQDIDTSIATIYNVIYTTNDSIIYQYTGDKFTLYFANLDDGLVLYGSVNEGCTNMVLPNNGVTLTNIYNSSKTITLNNYKIYDKAFEGDLIMKSLVIGDNCTEIGVDAFKYCKNLEIITMLSDDMKIGVGVVDGNFSLNYILTEDWNVARRISTYKDVYVKQTSGPSLTYVEQVVPGCSLYIATDANSKKWVRVGEAGTGYTYYKEYEISANILADYQVDAEGQLLKYIGSETDLELPETYSIQYTKYDGLYNGITNANITLPIEFDTPNGTVLVTTGEHLLAFVLLNLNTIETFTMRCAIALAIEGDDYKIVKIKDEAFPAGMTSIRLSSSVKEIESGAFDNCDNTLKLLTLPSSLETFEDGTFTWLSALTYVLCEDENVAILVNDEINESKLFVKQAADGVGVTYTDETIGNVTIATGTDSSSKNWVRTGDAVNGYTYYKQYAAGKTLTIMDETGSNVYEKIKVEDGTITSMPSREYATDNDGTSTKMIEGWYTDSAYNNKFEFGSELASNTTLYPKIVNVSTGLAFIAIAGGYSVKQGTCNATEVVVPEKYLGQPILNVASNGFSSLRTIVSICLPNTIKIIESSAFSGCNKLVLTELPSALTGIANYAFSGCAKLALTSLPSGVTTIGNYAFNGCKLIALTSLPSGITVINNNAFYNCTGLALTSLPSGLITIGNYAFYECTSLALTSLPSGVTSIGEYAFYNCSKMVINELPSGLTIINTYTFYGCALITIANLPSGLTQIEDYAFYGCKNLALTSLPSGFTSIESSAFSGCTNLALTSLPSGLITINSQAFSGCTNLALTSLPSGLKYIYGSAFTGCKKLALTSLPSGIKTIEGSVFSGCTSLELTELPSGVTSIGHSSFSGCTSLKLTSLPSGITTIGNSAFNGCTSLALTSLPSGVTSIGQSAFENCTSLALTSLPSGITVINKRLFYGCTSLALTSLPSGVTSIGESAFENCTSLALTSLPTGITAISKRLFYGCTSLALTELPSGVTNIGIYAFYNCSSLIILNLKGNISYIDSGIFSGCNNLRYVLCETQDVANLASGKGKMTDCIYIKEASDTSGATYTETTIGTNTIGVTSTPDASGYNWVRTGTTGNYTYYKCKVTAS